MRYALAALMFALSAVSAVIALGPLHNLWADYQDSPTSTYLMLGLPFVVLAILAALAGVRALRR